MAKILVIEDDENLLEHISLVLQLHQHEVTGYADVLDPDEIIALQPDLAILDIFLPHGNGVNLSKKMKGAAPELKIILTSADQHSLHFRGEAVADAVLPKPFSGEELLMIVEQTLD